MASPPTNIFNQSMKQNPIPTTLLVAAALSVFTACQTTAPKAAVGRFEKVDTNKDGKLSRAECSDYVVTKTFEGRDKNHDGKLTYAEWQVEGVEGAKARFVARDANKDGVVTLEEALAYGRKHSASEKAFTEADTNKDGFLSLSEAQAYYGSKEGPPN
jgi:Ca2+-binding EF-hand superfamily protein